MYLVLSKFTILKKRQRTRRAGKKEARRAAAAATKARGKASKTRGTKVDRMAEIAELLEIGMRFHDHSHPPGTDGAVGFHDYSHQPGTDGAVRRSFLFFSSIDLPLIAFLHHTRLYLFASVFH